MSDWPFTHTDRVRYADVDTMRHLNNVAFAELHLAYRAPAYFGEEIRTSVRPSHLERSSFRAEFRMAVADRLIAEGHGVYVGYDYAAERAQPLGERIVERIAPLLAETA